MAVLTYSIRGSGSSESAPPTSEVGGKARSLILCHNVNNVPGGFVLTSSFFEPWMRIIQGSSEWKAFASFQDEPPTKEVCDALTVRCVGLSLATEQRSALDLSIASEFGRSSTTLVAVRSSSPEEDLVRTSFAGGYETVLGVPLGSENELLSAIQRVFSSVFDYRVVQYKRQHGITTLDPRIAVIVQEQIDSSASGIAFSLNPLNNCYDEAVVTSNFGLGETVVSGIVTPDTFVVEKIKREILSKSVATKSLVHLLQASGGVREETSERPDVSLTDEQVLRVADLTSRVESFFGLPVDIEWAYGTNELHLLQARPVTTYFPLFPELRTAPGARKKLYIDLISVSQGFTDSLSPLGLDFWQMMLAVAQPYMPHGDDGLVTELNGREYILLSNLLASPGGSGLYKSMFLAQGGATKRGLEGVDLEEYRSETSSPKNKYVVWKLLKELLSTVPGMLWGLWDPPKSMQAYDQTSEKAFERYGVGGTEESNSQSIPFSEEVDKCLATCKELFPLIGGFMASFYSKWRLNSMFAGDTEAQDLLVALNMDLDGNPTSQMGHEMLGLARFPEVQETATPEEFVAKINARAGSDQFLAAYQRFIDRFGCRGMKEIDIATPRTREEPGDLFRRLKMIDVNRNQILTVAQRKEDAHRKLLEVATRMGKASTFQYHANVIQRTGGYREHPKYMFVFLVDYLRRRALVLGEQWVKDGRIDRIDDVFYMTVEEIHRCQQDAQVEVRGLVAAHRAVFAAYAHVKDWPALVDSRGRIFRGSAPAVEGGLGGDPISHGVVRGRANVLRTPYEKPLVAGEVLVTKATEPSWTPLFLNAAGVVLEVGGPLQHGAIIAREYGIPCVSGVDDATSKIRDGDWVEVDGTRGVVRILPEPTDSGTDDTTTATTGAN